jgi:electron transfer flavoprotein alpha subunit
MHALPRPHLPGLSPIFNLPSVAHLSWSPTMFSVARQSVLRQARTKLRLSQPATVPQYSAIARLLSTLAVLDQKDGKLNIASLAAVSAAQKLGDSVTAFVAAGNAKSIAEEVAKVKGIGKILYVENDAYDRVRASIRMQQEFTS